MPEIDDKPTNESKGRKCEQDWLTSYVKYNEGQESPDIFHLWCGTSSIAAVLERRVFIDRGRYKLYPNLYIILISESAISRRSTAINNAEPFVRAAAPFTNFISQKITEEKLINDLHNQYKKLTPNVSSGYLINDEITTLLGDSKKDSGLVGMITELYGCKEVWSYGTLKRDKDVIRKVCLNILGGSAPEWLRAGLPAFAVKGGFVGRLIFVYQPSFSKRIAFPDLTPEQILMKDDLIHDLKRIKNITGEYVLTEGAKCWFKYWYEKVLNGTIQVEYGLGGYYARKHDTLLKVGMVLAASKRDELSVNEEDLQTALAMLEENEKLLPETMMAIQSSDAGENAAYVLDIIRRDKIAHWKLLQKVANRFKAAEVKEILEGLIASRRISSVIVDKGRYYRAI